MDYQSPVITGDLNVFRRNGQLYIKFIDDLRKLFSEPNEKYGSIMVTKRDDGITKVNFKNASTEVSFIYRNRDLYIIGFVTGADFYVDKDVYKDLGQKIPKDWKSVIGTNNVVSIDALSYHNIIPDGSAASLSMNNLGSSLEELSQLGDKMKRINILSQHVAPFVIAFSEAIRFPVVARSVQSVMVKDHTKGVLRLDKNVIPELSLGHPGERKGQNILKMYDLLLMWGKLSERVEPLYKNQNAPNIKELNYTLRLDKVQLSTLIAVANSQAFAKFVPVPARNKRDLDYAYNKVLLQRHPLLEQDIINRIDYKGSVRQSSSSSGIKTPTIHPDLAGALQLLTVGMLYLYGRKMNMPTESSQSYNNPREAFGIAVDLVDRIVCFLKSAGFGMEIGFDEEMQLQRDLSDALIRGENVETVITTFLEEKYATGMDDGILDKVQEQLSMVLVNESVMLNKVKLDGQKCFQ